MKICLEHADYVLRGDKRESAGGIMMPILMTQTGDNVTVAKVIGSSSVKQRLGELGFVQGTPVSVVQAHNGDMIVKVRDSKLALTREMAAKIMVEM